MSLQQNHRDSCHRCRKRRCRTLVGGSAGDSAVAEEMVEVAVAKVTVAVAKVTVAVAKVTVAVAKVTVVAAKAV